MSVPDRYDFQRYLAAKQSVDDRALNRHVWQQLWEHFPPSSAKRPVRILELGAGAGAMLQRILRANVLHQAHYTAIDSDPANTAVLEQKAAGWTAAKPHFTVEPKTIDLFEFLDQIDAQEKRWDVIIAHAFLDLVELESTLPRLFQLLAEDGLFYFTINFDGLTILEPALDSELDALITRLYHQTMDERVVNGRVAGHSQTGRRLFGALRAAGAQLIAAGSSDWIIFAANEEYEADEAYFLHHLLHFFETSLSEHPDLDAVRFEAWLSERHAQIERGELVFIAHQIDFVGRVNKA